MPKLSGSDFVAQTDIFVATDKGMVSVARTGESCESVPAWDLARLVARDKIRRLEDTAPKKRAKE